jgi:hypothetical protein
MSLKILPIVRGRKTVSKGPLRTVIEVASRSAVAAARPVPVNALAAPLSAGPARIATMPGTSTGLPVAASSGAITRR